MKEDGSKLQKVLLTTATAEHNKPAFVREQVIMALRRVNLEPLIVHAGMPFTEILEMAQLASGWLIPGGADINPALYNEHPHLKTEATDPNRDLLEVALVQHFSTTDIPILGICHGAQLLWVAGGGKLIQHIPDSPVTLHNHGKKQPLYADLYDPTFVHRLLTDRNSHYIPQLHLTSNCSLRLPSMHHQAAQPNGIFEPLVVDAVATDMVIEIITHPQKTHVVGIQGHPEAWAGVLDEDSGKVSHEQNQLALTIFRLFAQRVEQYAATQ